MADSKFLKFQDINGDGLNDVCDDIIDVVPGKKCPACIPNPNYVAPNWRNRESTEPWLNEKHCKFQIAVTTSELGIPPVGPDDIFLEYVDEAVEGLIVGFEKADTSEGRSSIKSALTYQAYNLEARPMAYLKLLYSVPYEVLAALDPAEAEDEEDEEESEPEDASPIVVEMEADLIKEKLIRVRKAFNMYGRFYRVLNLVEGGKLIFEETNTLFSIKQFDRYGDAGLFPKSSLAQLLTSLNGFLNEKDLNIFGVGKISFGRDRVTKIEFKFSSKYKLRRLRVWTLGCGGKPYVYKKKRLKPLNNTSCWKDKTAVAYFAQLEKIDQKLQARQAIHWLDVVTEFTYPKIYQTFSWPEQEPTGPETALSCMGDALANEMTDLGKDILDEVLSIGDALAFQFNKDLCANSVDEFQKRQMDFGLVMDPNSFDPETGTMGRPRDLMSFATEQAFKQLQDDEQVFVSLCANVLSGLATNTRLMPGSEAAFLDNLYADGLERIKLCGLFDLMMDAINCLLGGLSLEAALSSIIKAALKGMSINNLSDFFIGLPPEDQAELDRLVQKKLEEGDIFKDPSGGAMEGGAGTTSDLVKGQLKYTPPWKREPPVQGDSPEGDPETLNKNKRSPTVPGYEAGEGSSQLTRRTLAQQFDVQNNAENELSDAVVIEAYIKALIEHYSDDLLSVTDMLNKYPGAQIIAKIIATMDCPRPPILQPSVLDFIKDLEIPWCRSSGSISLPMLFNPFGWIPKFSDLTYFLWWAFKIAIQRILLNILIKLLVKLCELIGDAICKALEVVGDIAASLPAVIGGKTTFREVIRDSICGDSASDEQIDATIVEMFEKLGVGGAALTDSDAVIAFAGDLSSATTRREMMNAFLGDMSQDMATAGYNIIQYEYPQFAEAFPTRESFGDFMANVGTLMPEDVKQGMRDFLDDLPEDDMFPANPTLCATPEQLDEFQDLRCTLLEGRATPEQCRLMFDNLQNDLAEDLEGIATMMQRGFPGNPEDYMPPIVSQPGCDDGMIPFESEEQQVVTGKALGAGLSALKKDYAEDMLGNGPGMGGVFGNWGLLNMVLSDTMGQPLTAHWRKASNRRVYVDFVMDDSTMEDLSDDDASMANLPKTKRQRGNFPNKVAPWLQKSLEELTDPVVGLNNTAQVPETITKTFDELGFVGLFGGVDIDKISIPDMGYNVAFYTDLGNETMDIVRQARKADPDFTLTFKDNNKGRREHDEGGASDKYLYGFDINYYGADLVSDGFGYSNIGTAVAPLDTARIEIINKFNPQADFRADLKEIMSNDEWSEYKEDMKRDPSIIEDRLFEFLAVDQTYENMTTQNYPSFTKCFNSKCTETPGIYLLQDIIANHHLNSSTTLPTDVALSDIISATITNIIGDFISIVSNNDKAFLFGAKYDDLSEDDAEYVLNKDQALLESGADAPAGTSYGDGYVEDEDGDLRKIRNSDMILGISRHQLDNGDDARIFYLDPTTYGGSYVNPAVYIKPIQYDGYMGMVNIMFPDFSPCKPRNTDLVDFRSIEKEISDTYLQIPEDQRLQADPDCVTEMPYNRILSRAAKAGIQGLIRSACRIFASVHYVKSYATFSIFNPDFENMFSSVYPQYIVENMERSFKDAQGAGWEFFNTFKDDEFWYAFLEQSVQTYGRLVDSGQIVDPPETVLQALFRINDAQENYRYPKITKNKNDVKIANKLEETDAPYRWPRRSKGLRLYRDEKNFEAVQATEEDAKIVLKEFVTQELKFISDKFLQNLASNGIEPEINDLFYYVLTNMAQGGIELDLDKEIKEEPVGLPSVPFEEAEEVEEGEPPTPYYTDGSEFALPDGEEYVGYYHVHLDQDSNVIYMVGEYHSSEAHEEITPFANKLAVPIGDINEYEGGHSYTTSPEKPFVIEKYISLNGRKMNPTIAIQEMKLNNDALNISEVYPGTMKLVYPPDQDGNPNETLAPVGIEGELGARHGLLLSFMVGGQKYALVDVEVDMLDLKISQAAPIEANSKLLLCLINHLKDHPETKYILDGVLSVKKILSTIAIYNDMGFLPSIGELTVADGQTKPDFLNFGQDISFSAKPGAKVTAVAAPSWKPAMVSSADDPNVDKWASFGDRQIFTPFNMDWDDWDQTLLKNSKSRIKKLFKHYYYDRKFNPADDDESTDFASLFVKNLKASLKPPTGKRILPWFRRRNVRDNPFNSNGEMCKKPEN